MLSFRFGMNHVKGICRPMTNARREVSLAPALYSAQPAPATLPTTGRKTPQDSGPPAMASHRIARIGLQKR